MRSIRIDTKISADGRKDMNYLKYIYGIKHDNALIEKMAKVLANKYKDANKGETKNEMDN